MNRLFCFVTLSVTLLLSFGAEATPAKLKFDVLKNMSSGEDIHAGTEVLRYSEVQYRFISSRPSGTTSNRFGFWLNSGGSIKVTERAIDAPYSSSCQLTAVGNTVIGSSSQPIRCNNVPAQSGSSSPANESFGLKGRVTATNSKSVPYDTKLGLQGCTTVSCAEYDSSATIPQSTTFNVVSGQDMMVSFDDVPTGTVSKGDEFEFEVEVKNNSKVPNGLNTSAYPGSDYPVTPTVTINLPSSLEIVEIDGGGFTCTQQTPVSCTGKELRKDDDAEIEIKVRVKNDGNAANKAAANIVATVDPGNNDERPGYDINNTASATVNISSSGSYDIDLSVDASPDPVDAGQDFRYKFEVENKSRGFGGSHTVKLLSVLPAGVSYLGDVSVTSGDTWSCSGDGGTPIETVSCHLTHGLNRDKTSKFSFKVKAPSSAGGNLNMSTTVQIIKNSDQSVQAEDSEMETVSVNAAALQYDIAFSRAAANPSSINSGDDFQYVFEVTNNGNNLHDGSTNNYRISLAANLPEGLIYKAVNAGLSGSGWSCSSHTGLAGIDCEYNANLAQNASTTLVLDMKAADVLSGVSPGSSKDFTISPSVEIKDGSSTVTETNAGNNSQSVTMSVTQGQITSYGLSLVKQVSKSEVTVGEDFEYRFVINNAGSGDLNDILLTDTLPTGVVYRGYRGSGWNCNYSNPVVNCSYRGTLAGGASNNDLVLEVTAPSVVSTVNNTAEVVGHYHGPAGNQSVDATGSVSVEVQSQVMNSDLTVSKLASATDVKPGNVLNWALRVSNSGPDAASSVTLTDVLPSGYEVSDVQVVSGSVNCSQSGSQVTCDVPSLANGDSVQVTINGRVSTSFSGSALSNTATVSSASTDNDLSNNSSTAAVNVLANATEADLATSLSADVDRLLSGDEFTFTTVTENKGPDTANGYLILAVRAPLESLVLLDSGAWQGCTITGSATASAMGLSCPSKPLSNGFRSEIKMKVKLKGSLTAASQVDIRSSISSSPLNDPKPANNNDQLIIQVALQPSEEQLRDHLRDVAGQVNEQGDQVIQNMASFCDRAFDTAVEPGVCEALWRTTDNDRADLQQMIKEVTPDEVVVHSASAAEIMASQFRNVDARLAELRGGGGGFSLAGLTARYGDQSLPLGMLTYLGADGDAKDRNSSDDFISPWGFFVNGTISMGERDATGREVGFDFDTYGITAGLDYRFSASKVIGLALGYANFDSKLGGEQGEVQSAGFTLTGYGSFYVNDHFYVDSRISYGRPDFEQKRRIKFNLGELQVDRMASGETEADQYTAAVAMGYHFNKNAWVITPNLTARYTRTSIGAFREYGAGGYDMRYAKQNIKSMVMTFGVSISKALSLKNGVLTPQFDVNMSRELENNGGMIAARFVGAPEDEVFWIQTDEPDRTFGNAGLGLVFVGASGKQAYVNYRSVFGLKGFSRGTWNAGLRFEF